jgi:mono/diheme cytochrome c family protein
MKTNHKLLLIGLAVLPLSALVVASVGAPKKPQPEHGSKALVERGKYLVALGGCNDCHTPWKMGPKGPTPDMDRYLSGHPEDAKLPPPPKLAPGPWAAVTTGSTAWSGPWGISYSANLTPDENTGLGIWTEEIFIKTMRTGKHYGVAREILPPMPWQGIGALTDEDLKAVFAYLKSLRPIRNHVPDAVPPAEVAKLLENNSKTHYE